MAYLTFFKKNKLRQYFGLLWNAHGLAELIRQLKLLFKEMLLLSAFGLLISLEVLNEGYTQSHYGSLCWGPWGLLVEFWAWDGEAFLDLDVTEEGKQAKARHMRWEILS